MKYVFRLGWLACLCLLALAGYRRVQALAKRELGVMTGRVDSMAAEWKAKGVPVEGRVVDFVLADAGAGPMAFVVPQAPGTAEAALAWAKRSLLGGPPAVEAPHPFAEAFADDPAAAVWVHDGFAAVSAEAMAAEVAKAVVKARDAGAAVNIVAQGASAVPVLKAVRGLEGAVRGGRPVGVGKLVVVGMSPASLQEMDPVFFREFAKPGNVAESAFLWLPRDPLAMPVVRLFSRGFNGAPLAGQELWPPLASQGSAIQSRDLTLIVKGLVAKAGSLESVIGPLAQAASARAEEAARRLTAPLSPDDAPAAAVPQPAAPPGKDSLSMIKGGEQLEGAETKEATAADKKVFDCGSCRAGRDGGMVRIPAGWFVMGSPEGKGYDDEHPQHRVYLDAYSLDRYEVTAAQFCAFSKAAKHAMPDQVPFTRCDHPVVNVDWNDAKDYCKWAGKRLPTEAQWERAARCGTDTPWDFGDSERQLGVYAWYKDNAGRQTHPVGQKQPNRCGLYDLYGNAWEWMADFYDETYYRSSPEKNPQGPSSGQYRMLRGASWGDAPGDCRAAGRIRANAGGRSYDRGLRCAAP
ncbi:MAG: SUMF1/EgtB/PvdO family nonheme iron enzyme [Elusimicrobia bacterium]|nr:SUMF1/EgtB/PvdO family nonheme iron enzyme [Elusimicrobiota bacterium]